ncbi:biopolymer transporter ExbD [Pigmentiphaga sp. NML080357]|uniref:ExbD/TolR family protein n=1 Tax=Pigmentiphaga sp. NML080357 TaxID=2008675 RepID=UPI000B414A18|nr:biopolymer transporter ExbD [Pigmentiphaga sp. NML080357]OVZ58788.1 biopolymer transporter ExbD [Pigmentiphaga sp. NML080357]
MNFRRHLGNDEPDINLIPLIDVLLVILIFLAASTSFSRFSQLSVRLPDASAQASEQGSNLTVTVAADGRYALNGRALPASEAAQLAEALRKAAAGRDDPTLVIDADASATHQAVVRAMEAAGRAGISRIGFTTQATAGSAR